MNRGKFTAAIAVGLAVACVACRGILGIDEDVPLLAVGGDGGPTTDGSPSGDGAGDPDGSGSNMEGASDAGLTDVDRRFAQWPLPPTHPLLSNYDLAAETVTDKTTSLVWQRNESMPATMSYGAAVAWCSGLTAGGQSDWRLPTRIELLSILDYGQTQGFLNNTVFPDGALPGAPSQAWTGSLSLLRAKLNDRFVLDVNLGLVTIAGNDQQSDLVRCVRGGPVTSPVNRYAVANGTAKDVRTNLVWQITPLATTMLLPDAKLACTNMGARLPDVRELASLVDESREVVPLLPPIFQAGPTARFWTSTLRANPQSANYAVDFGTANIHQEDFTTEKHSVRCVR